LRVVPLTAAEARKLIRRLLDAGTFVVVPHARDKMKRHDLNDVDAVNVLRGCQPKEAENENGAWRYRVETPRMVSSSSSIQNLKARMRRRSR
jgi:hypothetical protein